MFNSLATKRNRNTVIGIKIDLSEVISSRSCAPLLLFQPY